MNTKEPLAAIDVKKDRLSEYSPLTQGERERLKQDFMIRFIYNSNAIEGNTMTLEETATVLLEEITIGGKTVREHMEITGHRRACLFVEDLVKALHPLNEADILEIHRLVLMDRWEGAGAYRSLPVRIRGANVELPQPQAVPMEMEKLLAEYHGEMQTLHPVERAAVFHLRFESVHPFIDGNGRTGRLLTNLELMKCGYPPIDIRLQDRSRYMDCFKAWQGGDRDSIPMVLFTGEYVAAQLDEYLHVLELAAGHRTDQSPGLELR